MKKYKLIACVMTKNDEKVIGKCLQRLSECADGILVFNDGSTDRTLEIIKQFDKVIDIYNEKPGRKWDNNKFRHWIFANLKALDPEWAMILDSDDVLDKRFVLERERLLNDPEVVQYKFEEVTLWGGNQYYRVDKPQYYMRAPVGSPMLFRWTENVRHYITSQALSFKILFLLSRTLLAYYLKKVISKNYVNSIKFRKIRNGLLWVLYPKDYMDYANGYISPGPGKIVNLEMKKIHYHFFDKEFAVKKHMNYALQAAIRQRRMPGEIPEIVDWAYNKLNEDGLQLAPVKEEWGVL